MAKKLNDASRYKATSWQDFSREIARFVGNQGVTNILFYMFILLISAFVIANTTIMVVSKRRREIGILMARGRKGAPYWIYSCWRTCSSACRLGSWGRFWAMLLLVAITLLPLNVTSAAAGEGIVIAARPEYFVIALAFALSLNFVSGLYQHTQRHGSTRWRRLAVNNRMMT